MHTQAWATGGTCTSLEKTQMDKYAMLYANKLCEGAIDMRKAQFDFKSETFCMVCGKINYGVKEVSGR